MGTTAFVRVGLPTVGGQQRLAQGLLNIWMLQSNIAIELLGEVSRLCLPLPMPFCLCSERHMSHPLFLSLSLLAKSNSINPLFPSSSVLLEARASFARKLIMSVRLDIRGKRPGHCRSFRASRAGVLSDAERSRSSLDCERQ